MRASPYEGHFVEAFAQSYPGSSDDDRQQVMSYYNLGKLPALHALAQKFTVCDRWFSSVPGPTWANRFFFHTGTCLGTTIMPESSLDWKKVDLYDQPTMYDLLAAHNRSWRIYFHDFPQSLALSKLLTHESRMRFSPIETLEDDFRQPSSRFPNFVFIEPQYLGDAPNDDHPSHDTMLAQQLIARVYNALRSNDEVWNQSLLIVMYDEHGGFYDHVEPPPTICPDNHQKDYSYTQFGVRVPAVLISPWVKSGVFSETLDHTSVGNYLCRKWGMKPLGKRMLAANTFDNAILTDGHPRTDTPSNILAIRSTGILHGTRSLPVEQINENQKALVALSEHLDPQPLMRASPTAEKSKLGADEIRERGMRILKAGPAGM